MYFNKLVPAVVGFSDWGGGGGGGGGGTAVLV